MLEVACKVAQQRATIKDVAKLAQVSPSAVSMVLNGRDGLSEATKEKILLTIKEMNYHPSAASQRLVHRKSFNIAFIYPVEMSPFSDFFYNEVAGGLVEELTKHQFNVVFVPLLLSGGNYEVPDIIKKQDADAAIFLHDAPATILATLDELELPYVLLDWQSETKGRANIDFDNKQSAYRAAKYLIQKGHTQIAFFGSDRQPQFYLRCFAGYQRALDEAKLPIYAGWIQDSVCDVRSAAVSIKKLMGMQPQPTAVCCTNDRCAVYALKAATMLEIPVPGKLSFIGKDDISLSSFIYPGLTTVSYDNKKIGKETAQLLLKMLDGKTVGNVIMGGGAIIERESVALISHMGV